MSDIEALWKRILKDIEKHGYKHTKDDAEIKEILNISGFVDNPLMEIAPNYAALTKKQYIDFLKEGVFDISGYKMKGVALARYVESFDDEDAISLVEEDSFVYTYPERLQGIMLVDKKGKMQFFNQIEIICKRLKENKGSNRAVATLYSAGLDKDEEHIPCLNWLQALIRDDRLILSVMFRSNDIYNAFPSNMHFITYIGLSITEKLQKYYPSLRFDGFYYQCSSAHYYTDECNYDVIHDIVYGD